MFEKILVRVSRGGVPHTIYFYKGRQFSVCFFGKTSIYRIFDWANGENTRLADIRVNKGMDADLIAAFDNIINSK